MLDGFARSITYLRISITDRCNYRCRYCMPDGGIEKCAHEDICSLEGLRDMAAAAVGISIFLWAVVLTVEVSQLWGRL